MKRELAARCTDGRAQATPPLRLGRAAGTAVLLAAATLALADEPGHPNAKHGRILFLQCAACHSVEEDQQGKIGPPLKGVVGRRAGAVKGYSYSKALLATQLTWTPAELDRWLARPQALAPGTLMVFAGVPSAAERADLIAYLQTLQSAAQ